MSLYNTDTSTKSKDLNLYVNYGHIYISSKVFYVHIFETNFLPRPRYEPQHPALHAGALSLSYPHM